MHAGKAANADALRKQMSEEVKKRRERRNQIREMANIDERNHEITKCKVRCRNQMVEGPKQGETIRGGAADEKKCGKMRRNDEMQSTMQESDGKRT